MKIIKNDSLFLTKEQWLKIFTATSIMAIGLYIVAMIFSLTGNTYFIMNYQNAQMDRIEEFMRGHHIMGFITCLFLTLEFTIVLSFSLNKITKIIYPVIFYLSLVIPALFVDFPDIYYTLVPFAFYIGFLIIDQFITTKKFSWKKFGFSMLRLVSAVIVTLILQAMILVIKAGYFDGKNHVLTLSGYFIYSLEYDIALLVILFTISLYINREKGDSRLWTKSQAPGGSSQTSKTKSQKSSAMKKNLSKTQRNRLRLLYAKVYVIQLGAFLLIMVLPFLTGKVFEFLMMYFSFCVARYILGFNYSLHFKKESLCVTVGAVVFGILTLVVPFFYVDLILAISLGVSLAILLYLSYRYKSFYLFNKMSGPEKYATLFVLFDGDTSERNILRKCKLKGISEETARIVLEYMEGYKLSYLSFRFNYSIKTLDRKLNEVIDTLNS